MKRLVTICILVILILATSITAYAHEDTFDYNRIEYDTDEFKTIVSSSAMEGHNEHSVDSCSILQVYYTEIADMLKSGDSKDDIINYYVSSLGEEALSAPLKQGFSLSLWILPFLLLLIALLVVYFLIKRWGNNNDTVSESIEDIGKMQLLNEELLSEMIDKDRKQFFNHAHSLLTYNIIHIIR